MPRSEAPKNLRLFVAVYPPPATARVLLEVLAGLDLPPHRLVPPEQVHLTLQFIGDTPTSKLAAVTETVRRAAGGLEGFPMTPQRLITLPERRSTSHRSQSKRSRWCTARSGRTARITGR